VPATISGQHILADYLPHYPGLVVPARHAKKSQNMGIDQNLGACQEFTVFSLFLKQSIYLHLGVLSKNRNSKRMLTLKGLSHEMDFKSFEKN
jgi:hypothetical protein